MNSIKWGSKLSIKNRIFYAFFCSTIILLSSCSGFKRPAIGPDDLILVLSDETTFDMHKPQLEDIFNDRIYTPMPENRFNLRRIGLTEFNEGSAKYRFLIFLVNVDSDSPESKFIKKMLTENIMEGVRKGEYYYAVKEDIWARNQTALLLMDSKYIHLGGYLEGFSGKLFKIFNEKMLAGVKSSLFNTRYNNKNAQEHAKKKYDFEVFVPHDFFIAEERTNPDTFIRFRRFNPDRWLTVMRTKYNSDLSFQENVIQTRDRIGKQFGDSVKVNPDILRFEPDSTFSDQGIKLNGVWEYSEGGGPFFTRAFIKNDSFYLIDGAVFAPGEKKYPFLIQLELMSETVKFLELKE